MALLASEVLARVAAVYMNDPAKVTWTDVIMIPSLKAAWDDLQLQLLAVGARVFDEEVASPLSVAIGATTLAAPPADMIWPIAMHERNVGQTDKDWVPLLQEEWEADEEQGPQLERWIYREDKVQFLGATTTREVKLRYRKFLNPIVDASSDVAIVLANNFLAPRTAALLSGFKGANPIRATACNSEADEALEKIKGIYVKQKQGTPVRRPSAYFQD